MEYVSKRETLYYKFRRAPGVGFLEEWNFDPSTLAIQKKVIGIQPIDEVYADNNDIMGWKNFYMVYFTDIWTPFDGKLELKKNKTK